MSYTRDWSASELRVRLAPLNRFKPSSKIFYWPFQGGTSFVDLLWFFFLSCVCYAFVCVCLYVPFGHLLVKGWPLGSRLWCPTVSLSLFHCYPGSGVVLDCIDSWSLHPYLLWSKSFDLYLVALSREMFERHTMHHSKELALTFIMMLVFSRCTVFFNNYST